MRVHVFLSASSVLLACAASNASTPEPVRVPEPAPQAVEIAQVEAAPEIAEPPALPIPPRPDDEPETIPLSGAWAATFGHTLSYADAMRNVATARASFMAASKSLFESDGGVPAPEEFQKANSQMDLLNRRFAAAYYATNATKDERLAVLEEASATLLRWARRLDEVGLHVTPAAYRSDRRLSLTFEDVTEGPAKRWRNEGFQLSKLCLERAACKQLHDTYKAAHAKQAPPSKSPAPAECACNPGDPLCSATMSGWCRPTK